MSSTAQVSGLTTFTAGTPAKASEVNANFAAVKTAVDSSQAQIELLVSRIEALEQQLLAQQGSIEALDELRQYVSIRTINGKATVLVAKANLQVVNGLGSTDTVNGVGNFIVGYDERREPFGSLGNCSVGTDENATRLSGGPVGSGDNGGLFEQDVTDEQSCLNAGGKWSVDNKDGSHYLVVGPGHFYSQYGGIVAGYWNLSNGRYATAAGGGFNASSAFGTVVVGGVSNSATGGTGCRAGGGATDPGQPASCWPAGTGNPYLHAAFSTVLGGNANKAAGPQHSASTVSGGFSNLAFGSVSGGSGNKALGGNSSIVGGANNTASGANSSILGGVNKVAVELNQSIPTVP